MNKVNLILLKKINGRVLVTTKRIQINSTSDESHYVTHIVVPS